MCDWWLQYRRRNSKTKGELFSKAKTIPMLFKLEKKRVLKQEVMPMQIGCSKRLLRLLGLGTN